MKCSLHLGLLQRLLPLASGSNATGPLVGPGAQMELDYTGIKLKDPANATILWGVLYDSNGALWKYPADQLRYCDLGIGALHWAGVAAKLLRWLAAKHGCIPRVQTCAIFGSQA